MKKICKPLLAIAASLLLVPSVYAQETIPVQYQHEKYLMNAKGTIGYNKYLVSDDPDSNGEYMLRIENFVTGNVDSYAVPTDFVLVLDCSGSMLYDYRTVSQSDMPQFVSKAENDVSHFIVKDDGYNDFTKCTYNLIGQTGNYGDAVGGTKIWVNVFFDKRNSGVGSVDVSRYYFYEDAANPANTGYYYIYHKKVGDYYNLCIDVNGSEKYLWGTTLHDSPNTTISTTTQVIYTGEIWRPIQRREKLIEAVQEFATQIKEENDKDQWEEGVTKHQLAIVSFGSGYQGSSAASAMNDRGQYDNTFSYNTKVIKRFSEVTNPADYSTAMTKTMNFTGSTYIDMGVTLGRMLFERLQAQPNMEPVTNTGGLNRSKVMIVLTDGQPSGHVTASNYSDGRGVIKESLEEGVKIKTKRFADPHTPTAAIADNGICGLIFTIDLYNIDNSRVFLDHLSSNYPVSSQSGSSGAWGTDGYSGTKITPEESQIYYNDGSSTDLTEIFKQIGKASTGETRQMVAMDVMSDDFVLPFTNVNVDRVKIYTAECIGTKTFTDEPDKEYLAFAREVPVADRAPLAHLWVPYVEGEGESAVTKWRDLSAVTPFDLDGTEESPKITFTVSSDGKRIIVKGFNYSEMFCGVDPDVTHTEGELANTRQMAADDRNASYALPGYRGFKVIFEFPIAIDPDALGGVNVPTNDDEASGLYISDANGNPINNPVVTYPTPDLSIPVRLVIQKTGLKAGESANFTVQRKLRTAGAGVNYNDFTSFVLTGGDTTPEVRIINLDPAYYYKVKEGNWSWTYENVSEEYYTTDPDDKPISKNPVVFNNLPEEDNPKHAESKATNVMKDW